MWEVHLKGFEELEKKYEFLEDEDFLYIWRKPMHAQDSPVGVYIKWVDLEDLKKRLESMDTTPKFSKYLYKMYRDSSD